MILPMLSSLLAEIVPTWAIDLVSAQGVDSLLDLGDGGGNGLVDAALQVHRVHAGGDRLQAFVDDRLGQNGGGRGAVAGLSEALRGHFLHHLRAHVLELVLQFDFLGNRYAVLGDGRCAEGLVEHHVAAARAQGHLHGVGQHVYALQHSSGARHRQTYVFSSHGSSFAGKRVVCIVIDGSLRRAAAGRSLDHAVDFAFAQDHDFVAVDLDGVARVLAEHHLVADLHATSGARRRCPAPCPGLRPGLRPGSAFPWRSQAARCRRRSSFPLPCASQRRGRTADGSSSLFSQSMVCGYKHPNSVEVRPCGRALLALSLGECQS